MGRKSAKRARQAPKALPASTVPRLFSPFRALGLVTDATVPVHVFSRGLARYITAPLPRSFQVFDVQSMNLIGVGPLFHEKVTAIAAMDGEWTAVGLRNGDVIGCFRMKEYWRFPGDAQVERILVLEGEIIVLYASNMIRMWDVKSKGSHYCSSLTLSSSLLL